MAKGTHECSCPACGKAVKIDRTFRNSTEAREWEEYAATQEYYCYACNVDAEQERLGMVAKEMPYKEYKEKYADCKKAPDSYNAETKTIVVYVPANEAAHVEQLEADVAQIAEVIEALHNELDANDAIGAEATAKSHEMIANATESIYTALRTIAPQKTVEDKLNSLMSEMRLAKNPNWKAVSVICGAYVNRKKDQ